MSISTLLIYFVVFDFVYQKILENSCPNFDHVSTHSLTRSRNYKPALNFDLSVLLGFLYKNMDFEMYARVRLIIIIANLHRGIYGECSCGFSIQNYGLRGCCLNYFGTTTIRVSLDVILHIHFWSFHIWQRIYRTTI